MQTFLPYSSFCLTAGILDNKRLGNQVYVETFGLIRGKRPHHPASKMWRGYEYQLASYGYILAWEMFSRGDWDEEKAWYWVQFYAQQKSLFPTCGPPPWLGNADFHRSHQSNLIRKDPEYYGPFFPGVPDNLPYIWPRP